MRKKQKQMQPLGAVLDHIPRTIRRTMQRYEPWLRWNEIVGDAIAKNAQPASWHGGILIVRAANHAWIQELHFMREGILDRIRRACPGTSLSGIRFELAGPNDLAPPPAAAAVPPKAVALSPADNRFVRETVRPISDPETRAAIRRLIEKDLALKKRGCSPRE